MSNVILTVLNDNRGTPGLLNEWGWSLHIQTSEGVQILFDADSEPRVIKYNSEKLGVDLSKLHYGVLSHEHYDHYGGFSYVSTQKPGLPLFVPPGRHSWSKGLGFKLYINKEGGAITDRLYLTPPLRAFLGLYEHALIVRVAKNYAIIVVGCSHPGVDNLVKAAIRNTGFIPLLVIGGFHGPSKSQLESVARMSKYVSPAHCSGSEAVRYIEKNYPEKLLLVRTGSRIIIDDDSGAVTLKDYTSE